MKCSHVVALAVFLAPFTSTASDPSSAVFEAIRNNDLAFLSSLHESDIDTKDAKGATPLMHAAAFGSPEALKLLLDKGAAVNAKNTFDATALLWAAGDAVKARMLVEHHADVNVQSKQGRTPLMLAARGDGNSATVALLLAKGADPRPADRRGMTALHFASNAGDVESMRLLMEKGADVNAVDGRGDSPLMVAAGSVSVDAVRVLLSKGARVNVARVLSQSVKNGPIALAKVTPLMQAAPYGSPELIKALLDGGADVNAHDCREMTPLMFAVGSENQNAAVVRLLLRAGASVNSKSNVGETALDWAAKFGNPTVIALLKEAGARPGSARTEAPHTDLQKPREAPHAMLQSVALLQRSSAEFFRQSGCVGCHHQPATAVALRAARKAGLKVDESAARDQAELLRLNWELSADDMLQGIHRGGGSERIVNQLLGMSAAGYGPDSMTDAALADVVATQRRDGHWFEEPEPRAPIADSVIARAAYAIRAIQLFGWPGRRAEFDQRIGRARDFLSEAKARTGDDRAMLVLGLFWSEAPKPQLERAIHDLMGHQQADGGWSGNDNLPSDAFSTAESLVALNESAAASTADPAYRHGVEYLLKNQFQDGSWYVPSRAIKFQPYFQSGFPFDHDQWISMAATAMAVSALAPSTVASVK